MKSTADKSAQPSTLAHSPTGNKAAVQAPFPDNRPEGLMQRDLQEAANNSPIVSRQQAVQQMADTHVLQRSAVVQLKNEQSIKGDFANGGYAAHYSAGFTANHVLQGNTNLKAAKHHAGRDTTINTLVGNASELRAALRTVDWTFTSGHYEATTANNMNIRTTRKTFGAKPAAPAAPAALDVSNFSADKFVRTGNVVTSVTGSDITGAELANAHNSLGDYPDTTRKRATYRSNLIKNVNTQRAAAHRDATVTWIHTNFTHINGVQLDPLVHTTPTLIDAIAPISQLITVYINTDGKIYHFQG